MRIKVKKKDIKRNLTWYTFIIIPIITLAVLTYKPLMTSIYYSFTNMKTYGMDYEIVGWENYKNLMSNSMFLGALKNTILLAVYGLLTIPLGFLLANAINGLGRTKLQGFFRVTFYMPNIITGVSVVLVFQYVLKRNGGLLNEFLSLLTGQDVAIGWLSDYRYSHIGATILHIWMSLGYAMLINLANLQSIPTEIYEAAAIDGASPLKKMRYITIPQMKFCFAFLLITSMIGGLSRFTDLYILSGNTPAGKPNGTLMTMLMYIYQYSFETPRYGISSAGAMVLFVIVMAFTILNLKMSGFLKESD